MNDEFLRVSAKEQVIAEQRRKDSEAARLQQLHREEAKRLAELERNVRLLDLLLLLSPHF
jgi:hypothetical protein